jgi:hypothetical protein
MLTFYIKKFSVIDKWLIIFLDKIKKDHETFALCIIKTSFKTFDI